MQPQAPLGMASLIDLIAIKFMAVLRQCSLAEWGDDKPEEGGSGAI